MPFESEENRKAFFANLNNKKSINSKHIKSTDGITSSATSQNKMLRTTLPAEEQNKLYGKIIPKYQDALKKFAQHSKTVVSKHAYYLKTREELGRKGTYDKYDGDDIWMLHGSWMPKDGVYNTENILERKPELRELWDYMQKHDDQRARDNFLIAYLESEIESQKKDDQKEGRFTIYKVVKNGDGFSIAEIQSPEEQFINAVLEGKIKDENGLKLSVHQVEGKPPAVGYMNNIEKLLINSSNHIPFEKNLKHGVYVGMVVSIDDLDPTLDHYKMDGVITEIIDDYHYRVKGISPYNANLIIRDTDIRDVKADSKQIFSSAISKEDYEKRIKPTIEKLLKQ